LVLQHNQGTCEVITSTKDTPYPKLTVAPSVDVNISWLVAIVSGDKLNFSINRSDVRCHTPRQNPDVIAAIAYFVEFGAWVQKVATYFTTHLFPIQARSGLDLSKGNGMNVFVPVVPLFEASHPAEAPQLAIEAPSTYVLSSTPLPSPIPHIHILAPFYLI
jgi:hypothetical protein